MANKHHPASSASARQRTERAIRHKDRARLVSEVSVYPGPKGTSSRTAGEIKEGERWFRGAIVRAS